MHGHIILTWVDIIGIRQITKSSLSVVSRSESEVSNATPLNKSARLPVPTEMPEFCHVIRQQRVQPVMLGPPLFSRIYSLLVKIDGRISTMRARQTDINRLRSSETDSRPNFSFLFYLQTFFSLSLVFCYLFIQSVFLFFFFFFHVYNCSAIPSRRYLDTAAKQLFRVCVHRRAEWGCRRISFTLRNFFFFFALFFAFSLLYISRTLLLMIYTPRSF